MLEFRSTLTDALREIESGTLRGARAIIVSRPWWDEQSSVEQDAVHARCSRAGIELSVDDRLTRHLVEVRGDEPPLSSEHRA